MVVYIIIHRKTGCCYVGQTIRRLKDRIRQHCRGRKQFIDKIIRLEGREAFEVGVLDICDSVKELSQRERYWIKYFNCVIPHGFNIDAGSNNSQRKPHCRPIICITTGEKFQSLAEASLKLGIHEVCIDRVCKGRRISTHKLKFAFADNLCAENPIPKNYCRVLCLENGITYDSTSEASRKLNLPRNSIRKVCFGKQENVRGFHFVMADIPAEERKIFQLKPDSRLRVRCLETGAEYESISEAGRQLGIFAENIGKVCHGERKSTGGKHFEFCPTASPKPTTT